MAIKIHTPWNKNRVIGQKKPLQISQIWGIRIRLELKDKLVISHCSILGLIANYEVVTSLNSRFQMLFADVQF